MLITIPELLSNEQVDEIVSSIELLSWGQGHSTDEAYRNEVKHNQELENEKDGLDQSNTIYQALTASHELILKTIPDKMKGPMFNKYTEGGTYRRHIDAAFMGNPAARTDLSVTIFLSDPDTYEGGELVMEHPSGEEKRIKGPKGSLICYATDVIHYVAPVTQGTRFAAITWIQSKIQDTHKRNIATTVHTLALQARRDTGMAKGQYAELMGVYQNLLRMWST